MWTFERGRRSWSRQALVGVLFTVSAIGLLPSSTPTKGTSTGRYQFLVTPSAPGSAGAAQLAAPRCRPGEVAIDPADVGIGHAAARCLEMGGDEVRASRVDPLYARVASELVAHILEPSAPPVEGVKVICWNEADWRKLAVSSSHARSVGPNSYALGWAPKRRAVINLSYLACLQLDRLAYRDSRLAFPFTGAAVGTLAHEAMHVAGILDEGIADCYALQLTRVTALRLGAQPELADLLGEKNFEFARQQRSGTEYDSPDCHDGGPLDLAPLDPRWP